MEKIRAFLRRKDIVFSAKRYFIDAMGAMAQGLFCTLLVGTILNTIGQQFHIGFLNAVIVTIGKGDGAVNYTIGGLCSAMVGPGMAVAIAGALKAPPLVLFSLIPVGFAANYMGGAGGPLAVLFVALFAAEVGKAVSKETKIDILVTPIVTVLVGVGFAALIAAPVGTAAAAVGQAIIWATKQQPFFMGIIVSVVIGIALVLGTFAKSLVSLFNQDPEVIYYGTQFVWMTLPFRFFGVWNQTFAGALRGAGDTRGPMLIMLFSFVFCRQAYLFIVTRFVKNIYTVGLGYPFGWVMCAFLSLFYYCWKQRRFDAQSRP